MRKARRTKNGRYKGSAGKHSYCREKH
jgi:hypothetical protein